MSKVDKLYMLAPSSYSQMMGFVYRLDDTLIVIDGGTKEDYENLLDIIKENGSVIDLLIVTHCHHDHIGALVPLINNKDICIKQIIFDFPCLRTIKSILRTDWEYQVVLDFLKAVRKNKIPVFVPSLLEPYLYGRFVLEFLKLGDIHHKDINDSSLIFSLKTPTKSLLFLGDISPKMSEIIAKKYRNSNFLRCDYVQLAHHGQSGGSFNLYKLTKAKYAFWCAPRWLYDNDIGSGYNTGPFTSENTKKWMEELKISNITAFNQNFVID